MATFIGSWEVLGPLGEGGQGKVTKVRSASAASRRDAQTTRLRDALRDAVTLLSDVGESVHRTAALAKQLSDFNLDDRLEDLGAAKQFVDALKGDPQSIRRLEKEVAVLRSVTHPAVLRLLDADVPSSFIVTEYHPGGTLAKARPFVGKPLEALLAIRPVVEALVEIHKQGSIHRDIKPANILIAADKRLVLGDFGIVFLDDDRSRVTDTVGERVGSEAWIAPWADHRVRIDEVKQDFDLYPLGKTIWSMIAGDSTLKLWYFDRPGYDLTERFPSDPGMPHVNRLLGSVVVEKQTDCVQTAAEFLRLLDIAISKLRVGAPSLSDAGWPCRLCGEGRYAAIYGRDIRFPLVNTQAWQDSMTNDHAFINALKNSGHTVRVFACSSCGHLEWFWFKEGKRPVGWPVPKAGSSA